VPNHTDDDVHVWMKHSIFLYFAILRSRFSQTKLKHVNMLHGSDDLYGNIHDAVLLLAEEAVAYRVTLSSLVLRLGGCSCICYGYVRQEV
jgi:hypothetical protein